MSPDPRRIAQRARHAARRLLRRAGQGPAAEARPTILDTDAIASLPRTELEERSRALASPLYLGDNMAICRILARYKLYLDSRDQDLGGHVLLDGFWESWVTQFMARTVRRGWRVADVGANYGYYSVLLADLVGAEGHVFAVEPNPAAAEAAGRSLALNGFAARSAVVAAAAGGPGEGRALLWVPEWSPGHAALARDLPAPPPGVSELQVPVVTVDELVGAGGNLDFIKIDAEGAEERIVEGMSGLFARQRPDMVLEFNTVRYADPGAFLGRLAGLYGRLHTIGYDGNALAVTPGRVLNENFGQEWLLYLSAR